MSLSRKTCSRRERDANVLLDLIRPMGSLACRVRANLWDRRASDPPGCQSRDRSKGVTQCANRVSQLIVAQVRRRAKTHPVAARARVHAAFAQQVAEARRLGRTDSEEAATSFLRHRLDTGERWRRVQRFELLPEQRHLRRLTWRSRSGVSPCSSWKANAAATVGARPEAHRVPGRPGHRHRRCRHAEANPQ